MAKKKKDTMRCKICGNSKMIYRQTDNRYAAVCGICGKWQKWISEKDIKQNKIHN